MKTRQVVRFLVVLMLILSLILVVGCKRKSEKPYIPVISKGFQHQFWQAVKQGAEKAAKDYDVEITFEGPESEAMVDKQLEMFQTALDKKPDAILPGCAGLQGADPVAGKSQSGQHSGDRL